MEENSASYFMKKAFILVVMGILVTPLGAVDVSPSRDLGSAREKNDAAGSGPGWFSGVFDGTSETRDKKMDKVKNINRKDFDVALVISTNSISSSGAASDSQYAVQPYFTIKNNTKLLRTFSFPNSQKYDFMLVNSGGTEVARWSEGRTFTDIIGSTLINPGESVRYTEVIQLFTKDGQKLPPGEYTLVSTMIGYPDFTESIKFNILP
ncbi:MAG: BsuPI-related putative proteinase inhibitor [Verrucomicrobiota bacterium]|nr:BsuPI-related putative proteinase inhibitor [Verrucomicrobiota bacterium]